MQRIAVIARLRPGAAEEAARLIELGPPFDPPEHGIERHTVFLAPDVALFVFEGGHVIEPARVARRRRGAVGAWSLGAAARWPRR